MDDIPHTFDSLKSHVIDGQWEACIEALYEINTSEEITSKALVQILKVWSFEYLKNWEDSSAIELLKTERYISKMVQSDVTNLESLSLLIENTQSTSQGRTYLVLELTNILITMSPERLDSLIDSDSEFTSLKSDIVTGKWKKCANFLSNMKYIDEETKNTALLRMAEIWLLESVRNIWQSESQGSTENYSALNELKEVCSCSTYLIENFSLMDVIESTADLREKLIIELQNVIRLDSSDQFPTETVQNSTLDTYRLFVNYLRFLPYKTQAMLRCTSRFFNEFVTAPKISGLICQFHEGARLFLSIIPSYNRPIHSSLDFVNESLLLRSSSNGLLLCDVFLTTTYCVCNPINCEHLCLPLPKFCHMAILIAYDSGSDNFHVIGSVYNNQEKILQFEIFSLRERSWTVSPAIYEGMDACLSKDAGFYSQGVTYWMLSDGKILILEMTNQAAGVRTLPYTMREGEVLADLRGEVCSIHTYVSDQSNMECVFEFTAVVTSTLTRRFSVKVDIASTVLGRCSAITCMRDRSLVLLLEGTLMVFDMDEETLEIIGHSDSKAQRYIPFIEVDEVLSLNVDGTHV